MTTSPNWTATTMAHIRAVLEGLDIGVSGAGNYLTVTYDGQIVLTVDAEPAFGLIKLYGQSIDYRVTLSFDTPSVIARAVAASMVAYAIDPDGCEVEVVER